MLVIIKSFRMKIKGKREKNYIIESFFLLLIYFCSTIGRKRKQSFLVKLICYYCPLCSSQNTPNGVNFFFPNFFFLYINALSRTKYFWSYIRLDWNWYLILNTRKKKSNLYYSHLKKIPGFFCLFFLVWLWI